MSAGNNNTAERELPRGFMEFVEDNFLINQGTGPLLVNREGLMGDVKVGCCSGHSDHKIIVFNY